jgi:hypothetical protein
MNFSGMSCVLASEQSSLEFKNPGIILLTWDSSSDTISQIAKDTKCQKIPPADLEQRLFF